MNPTVMTMASVVDNEKLETKIYKETNTKPLTKVMINVTYKVSCRMDKFFKVIKNPIYNLHLSWLKYIHPPIFPSTS